MSPVPLSLHGAWLTLALAVTFLFNVPLCLAEPKTWNFDKDKIGALPLGWLSELSGEGSKRTSQVLADPTAPSNPKVLVQTSADSTNSRFPLAVVQSVNYRDVVLSVQFKIVSGKRDQAAGLVWRYQDANNYYGVLADALEGNVVMFKVERGRRIHLNPRGVVDPEYGVKITVPANTWQELIVKVSGNLFLVSLNDETLFELEDDTLTEAGNVGFWTKADSVTHFDNFTVDGR
jgi:hypothetical protein